MNTTPDTGRQESGGRPLARPQAAPSSRYAIKTTLAPDVRDALAAIVGTYAPDLHDPAAVEVLLAVREVLTVLGLPIADLETLFGRRLLGALATWGDIIVPGPGHLPLPADRAWVWLPHWDHPRVHRRDRNGFIYVKQD
jgi:hypothetical protein